MRSRAAAWMFVGAWVAGCATGQTTAKTEQPAAKAKSEPVPAHDPERLEGGRKTSPSVRASDSRPKPWVEEKRPFDDDRTGAHGYRVVRRAGESARKRTEAPEKAPAKKKGHRRPGPAEPATPSDYEAQGWSEPRGPDDPDEDPGD